VDSVSRARIRLTAIYLAMMGWAVLWSVPWHLNPAAGLPTDLSFTPLAHVFFAQGRPWGASTLHTSGVWGFLRFSWYDPRTFPLFVFAHVALGAIIGWFFADRSLHLPRHRWVLLLTSAVLLPLLSTSDDARWYIPIFALLVMRTQDRSPGERSALVWALALAAALSVHAKGNLYIATAVVAAALLASDLYQRRKPWTVLLIVAFAVGLLYAGGGNLAGFGRYTIHVIESMRAYPEAFSQSNDAWAPALFLLAVACVSVARWLQTEHRWQWPLAIAFAVLLFLLYKGAYVRHDVVHVIRSLTTAVLVVGTETVAAICCWPSSTLPRGRAVSATGLAITALALFLAPLSDAFVREVLTRNMLAQPVEAVRLIKEGSKARHWRHERQMARIRRAAPLGDIDGSIATIGTYQTPLLAHHLHAETIPIIAHYEVWSPRTVAAMNRYLESDEAPRFLVRSANYASASNEITVARLYRTVFTAFYYTLLERRAEPLVASSRTLFDGTVRWGEPIDIPPEYWSSLLVADVRFQHSMAGRLVGFLHHPPHAQMVLERTDGGEAFVRMNSWISGHGVVVSADTPPPTYGVYLHRRGVSVGTMPKTIQEGYWGGSAQALHLARHRILTEVQSKVRRITFRARTLRGDASALFEPELHVRIRVVSFSESSQP